MVTALVFTSVFNITAIVPLPLPDKHTRNGIICKVILSLKYDVYFLGNSSHLLKLLFLKVYAKQSVEIVLQNLLLKALFFMILCPQFS